LLLAVGLLAYSLGCDSAAQGGLPDGDLCAFFDDKDNCFTKIVSEARDCVGDSFSSTGQLSADGLSCSSQDGALQVSFAQPITSGTEQKYDVSVRRGDRLCFRYQGEGSGSTPATFAAGDLSLSMSTDPGSGALILACEGRTFRGNLFTKCSGEKYIPSVSTSFFREDGGKKSLSMSNAFVDPPAFFYKCAE
jgi:hypothetical protein